MQGLLLNSGITEPRPLISVCCICQRHRTSIDTWEPFDDPEDTAELDLTHGFCPDCIREHYPKVSTKLHKMDA